MKDEIKLKDMTDFLENVYKDIKKQPTLEEELEKERKFINKIKDDNEDEIKEILRILKAKSKRYEYCLNANISYSDESYEAHLLLDYITNLQEENMKLISENETIKNIKYVVDKTIYKSRCEKAYEYLDKFIPNEYGVLLTERQWNYAKELLQGEDNE
jgi:hypothetical protein